MLAEHSLFGKFMPLPGREEESVQGTTPDIYSSKCIVMTLSGHSDFTRYLGELNWNKEENVVSDSGGGDSGA